MSNQKNDVINNRIILYGAGITGVEQLKILSNYYNFNVAYFCDTYKNGFMSNKKILTPNEMELECCQENFTIIVTAVGMNAYEIKEKLLKMELNNSSIYTASEFAFHTLTQCNDDWYLSLKNLKSILAKEDVNNIYLEWWCPEHYCEGDVLVYQPGKVGSSSVCNSLAIQGISSTHVHMLTSNFICDLIPELAWIPNMEVKKIIEKASKLCVDKILSSKNIKIITIVREPIIRDYSQTMYHMNEVDKNFYLKDSKMLVDQCVEGMVKRSTQNGKLKFGYQFEWFNKELKEVFDIDIYNFKFDQCKGYSIIKKGNIELLVIKLERMDELEKVIGSFVGLSTFKIINSNNADEKYYKDTYSELKNLLELPEEYCSMYYNGNSYMNHFYSEIEQKKFKKIWKFHT